MLFQMGAVARERTHSSCDRSNHQVMFSLAQAVRVIIFFEPALDLVV